MTVPRDAILRRFDRSVANLAVAAEFADRLLVLDNSAERPRLVIVAESGREIRVVGRLPTWLSPLIPNLRVAGP